MQTLREQLAALGEKLAKQWAKCRTCGAEWAVFYDPKHCPSCSPNKKPEPAAKPEVLAVVEESFYEPKDVWKDEEPPNG